MERMGAPLRLVYASDRIALPGVYIKPSHGAALFHQSTLEDVFGVEGLSATAGIRFDYERTGLDYRTESNGGDVYIVFTPAHGTILVEGDTLLVGSARKVFWEVLPKFALKVPVVVHDTVLPLSVERVQNGRLQRTGLFEVLQSALAESLMRNVLRQIPVYPPCRTWERNRLVVQHRLRESFGRGGTTGYRETINVRNATSR